MTWLGLTDDDLPYPKVADGALAASKDWGAAVAELGGYRREEDERKSWSVAAFEIDGSAVAIHIDWEEQTIIVARQDDG